MGEIFGWSRILYGESMDGSPKNIKGSYVPPLSGENEISGTAFQMEWMETGRFVHIGGEEQRAAVQTLWFVWPLSMAYR